MSESIPVPKNYQYLKHGQIRELESEARSLRKAIEAPNPHGADKGDMGRRLRRIEGMLAEQSPPDLNPTERDAFSRRARELEEQFTQGMPSGEEMRKNPPGAVDKNLAWHRKNALKVAEWKNLMRVLHKHDDSPNYANIERFRPHRTDHDLSMEGAEIPGKTFVGTNPSPAYKEGWDRTFAGGEDPEKQALIERLAKVEAELERAKSERKKRGSPVSEAPCGARVMNLKKKKHMSECPRCHEIEQQTDQPAA